MKFLILLLAAALCDARPRDIPAQPALFELGAGSFIVGGTETTPGQYNYQLSQQRLGVAWSHSCGAVLLGPLRALTAAHCTDGASTTIIRVLAGLHSRSNPAGAVISNSARHANHIGYNDGQFTFNNDIGIIHLQTAIPARVDGIHIGYARLPENNNNLHTGETCIISGWGRNSASNVLPDVLLHVAIQVISEAECNQRMAPVAGARVSINQICLFSPGVGSCNGDSGGPLHCGPGGNHIVSGVTSWGIQSGGACLQTYPSVYTRTGTYLAWIDQN